MVVLIIVFAIIDSLLKKDGIFPYQKKKYFLTPTERKFFEILLQIINNQYFIFPQVHIASIVEVKKGQQNYISYFNKIIRKSFDFVIFDKQNLNVLLVIELDDKTHERPDRMDRDANVNKIAEQAKLKILHIKPQDNYNIFELTKIIYDILNSAPTTVVPGKEQYIFNYPT